MANRFFSKLQAAKEVTRGTALAATKLYPAQVTAVKPDRKPTYPIENFGVRADSMRSVVGQYLVQDTLSNNQAYFQLMPLLFGCGLKGGITPTMTTALQNDYLWTFTPSLTAANAPDSFTGEKGDDTQAFEYEYSMFERIKLAWSVTQGMENSPVSVEADYFARQLTPTTFTPALTAPVVTAMNGKLSRLFIDTTWAGVGVTEKTNTLRGADIEILTGVHPVFSGSANKYFDNYAEGLIAVTLQLTLEGNAAANAIFTAQQAQTLQVVRLTLNGPQIGTGTPHKLDIDVSGTWESVTPMASEERSDNLHTATLRGFYDLTGAKLMQVILTTNVLNY